MSQSRIYSSRLGAISDEQFGAVAARLNLGRFLRAEPTVGGLFGQNVFVTTTEGDFVLRGAPHWVNGAPNDRWQFTKEAYFARLLHERTQAAVPWPMLHDEQSDIFGWPYLVMPRMPGACFNERTIIDALNRDERGAVAVALAEGLVEQQRLTSPFAGDFDPSVTLCPYPHGNTRHVIDETLLFAASARKNGAFTDEDDRWIDSVAERALASNTPRPNVYVHGDYKLNNLTVMQRGAKWTVSGVFDLHESRFGDGAADLVRQACSYLDTDAELAKTFVEAYLGRAGDDATLAERMPLYIAQDRIKLWEYFTRPDTLADWTKGRTFRRFAQRYIDRIAGLL
jgi:aminoglycoside phosphotransferase (APT) family kinase protein